MTGAAGLPAVIPSPTQGVWYLGPFPVRAYALFILVGILVAIRVGERRWIERGGRAGTVLDIAAWAVPFGIVGGRLYHVVTSWQPYFGPGGDPVNALYVWHGGLGIWGAVAFGGLGAWIAARRAGIALPPLADALAPGIVLAQAVGRWGNWFNNELYGSRTDLPWGLRIYEWDTQAGHAVSGPDGRPVVLGTFHPTFLYESLWDVGVAGVLIWADRRFWMGHGRVFAPAGLVNWADRRFQMGHGRVFALYVLLYTMGRGWIEALRVDPANRILGLRLNLWTSLVVGLGAFAYLVFSAMMRPGRETTVLRESGTPGGPASADDESGDAEPDGVPADGVSTDAPADPPAGATPEKPEKPGGEARDSDEPAADEKPDPGRSEAVGSRRDKGVPGDRISDSESSNNDSQ